MGLALIVGVIAGLGAIVFNVATQAVDYVALDLVAGYHAEAPGGEHTIPIFERTASETFRPWAAADRATVGGLLSGLLVFTFAPEAEGHGTDAAIAAYHYKQGYIRPRVPLVKIVASALTLGTGGSGGREGPIAQIGAGFGSFLGSLLQLRPAERRMLMAAGMGAGVAAIFRAPLAGALFAAEVLYRSPDFESEVIIPAGLASVMAYCTFGLVFGWDPLFDLPPTIARHADLRQSAAAGVLHASWPSSWSCWRCSTRARFYGLTHLFHRLPIRPHFKPGDRRLPERRCWAWRCTICLRRTSRRGAVGAVVRLRHPARCHDGHRQPKAEPLLGR